MHRPSTLDLERAITAAECLVEVLARLGTFHAERPRVDFVGDGIFTIAVGDETLGVVIAMCEVEYLVRVSRGGRSESEVKRRTHPRMMNARASLMRLISRLFVS